MVTRMANNIFEMIEEDGDSLEGEYKKQTRDKTPSKKDFEKNIWITKDKMKSYYGTFKKKSIPILKWAKSDISKSSSGLKLSRPGFKLGRYGK